MAVFPDPHRYKRRGTRNTPTRQSEARGGRAEAHTNHKADTTRKEAGKAKEGRTATPEPIQTRRGQAKTKGCNNSLSRSLLSYFCALMRKRTPTAKGRPTRPGQRQTGQNPPALLGSYYISNNFSIVEATE